MFEIDRVVVPGIAAVRFDRIDLRFENTIVLVECVLRLYLVSEQRCVAFDQTHGALSSFPFIVHDIPNDK